jgi:hypothetical protein
VTRAEARGASLFSNKILDTPVIFILPSLFVNVTNGLQLGKYKKDQENMEIARIHFWGIDSVGLFYVLAGISVIIFLIGFYLRISIWLAGIKRDKLDLSTVGTINLLKDAFLAERYSKEISLPD